MNPDILGDDALVHLKGKLIFLLHQNVLSGTSMAKDSVKLQKSQQFACAQKLAVKGEVVVTEKDVPARWIQAGRYPSNSPIALSHLRPHSPLRPLRLRFQGQPPQLRPRDPAARAGLRPVNDGAGVRFGSEGVVRHTTTANGKGGACARCNAVHTNQ